MASVAVFVDDALIYSGCKEAQMRASGVVLEMIRDSGKLQRIDMFCADVGPGSFTGTRVGVTIVKTLAYALHKKAARISAFDLLPANSAIPARAEQYYLRKDGEIIIVGHSEIDGCAGYGKAFESQVFPDASAAKRERLVEVFPEALVPEYVLEPNISRPKRPFGAVS